MAIFSTSSSVNNPDPLRGFIVLMEMFAVFASGLVLLAFISGVGLGVVSTVWSAEFPISSRFIGWLITTAPAILKTRQEMSVPIIAHTIFFFLLLSNKATSSRI